ncbi:endo-alpha-N-acetylgalactosaminidase family protein, partial [Escherichia coli]|nr:endo-alpha-N-acetylgalactosaminidase family protein [Escherichia coli]
MATNTTWSHWSADENYGGSGNKGINSQILRFVGNSTKDTWNPDPKLGNAQVKEFEGWTGQNDYNAFSKNIWTTNLPTKFLQQQ